VRKVQASAGKPERLTNILKQQVEPRGTACTACRPLKFITESRLKCHTQLRVLTLWLASAPTCKRSAVWPGARSMIPAEPDMSMVGPE